MASARSSALISSGTQRTFCGEFQFDDIGQGTQRITLTSNGERAELRTRAIPLELREGGGWFNILLISCYHRAEADHDGLRAALSRIVKEAPPHLSVLMGDQVYLDLPTLMNFKDNQAWLEKKFEKDYINNWMRSGGFCEVLRSAPSVCLPDDHEYWNNAPHPATVIQNSWKKASRARWMNAARAMYQAFQAPTLTPATPFRLDVAPISFLFADSRTPRQEDRQRAFSPTAMTSIQNWVKELNQRNWVGAFVTGQPVLAGAESGFSGRVEDWALANYGDHTQLMRLLGQCKNHLFLLTGDVHWGRTAQASRAGKKITDVVVSPAALVTTVGGDQGARAWNWLKGLAGKSEQWPRHSDPPSPPTGISFGAGARVNFSTLHATKGDQLAVLSFRKSGGKLESKIRYFHVQQQAERSKSVRLLP